MHLNRETLDIWATRTRQELRRPGPNQGYVRLLQLAEGDNMATGDGPIDRIIEGPAIVELVVYLDGGWAVRERLFETVESIALRASLGRVEE